MSSTIGSARMGGRWRGMAVGAIIGGAVALLEALSTKGDEPGIRIGVGAILAGSIGGWLFAPFAIRARSRRRIALVVFGFAMFATVLGAIVVAEQLAFRDLPRNSGLGEVMERAFAALTVAGFGILIVGPLTSPLVLGAAAIWSAVVRDPSSVIALAETAVGEAQAGSGGEREASGDAA